MVEKFKIWLKELRAPFFTASIVPVFVGTASAWHQGVPFRLWDFIICLIAMIALHAGCNMANDYYDYVNKTDMINEDITPFSGGSRMIPEGFLKPKSVLIAALIAFGIGSSLGLYLVWTRGWPILVIGIIGVFLAFFYSAPPVFIASTGLGELAISIGFGPLPVLGAYYVQAQSFSIEALWASVPVALLIAAVIYINEFPDVPADSMVGKKTLVVRLGKAKALYGYLALLFFSYAIPLLGVALGYLPWPSLLIFITIPLAVKSYKNAARFYNTTPRLIPSNAFTILIHLTTGILLTIGLASAKFIW
ncbi:MAG: 1,4-dihydroxy-2-naphthoate octaprenyltransferase [Candidatus Eremiobacteraeota bacterium]|nr:1,4-dihydroxy-2-naphthoate octaprenyltransferase [Candidatus Eremiobacteraeota bacterium]